MTTAILMAIINLSNSIRAVPIIVYLPYPPEVGVPPGRDEKYMLDMCQRNKGVICFSTRPALAEKTATGNLAPEFGGHWSPAGNRAIAEAIKDYLIGEGYVSSSGNPGHPTSQVGR